MMKDGATRTQHISPSFMRIIELMRYKQQTFSNKDDLDLLKYRLLHLVYFTECFHAKLLG